MPKQYGQLKRMREKAARLKEKARQAGNPKMVEMHLRRADNILASVQAIQDNWKAFGERARGNTNFRGKRHSREAREEMRSIRKAFWRSKAGREKMWRARKRRQSREQGICLLRFPRLAASSTDQKWLATYRKRYRRITGERLGKSDIRLYREAN